MEITLLALELFGQHLDGANTMMDDQQIIFDLLGIMELEDNQKLSDLACLVFKSISYHPSGIEVIEIKILNNHVETNYSGRQIN